MAFTGVAKIVRFNWPWYAAVLALDAVPRGIDPAAVDPEDVEMLQDVIVAAVNEAMRSAQQLAQDRLGTVAGGLSGLGLPGL